MKYKPLIRTTITKTYRVGGIHGVHIVHRGGQPYLRGFLRGKQIDSPRPISMVEMVKLFGHTGGYHA